jgi:hypothetical protein
MLKTRIKNHSWYTDVTDVCVIYFEWHMAGSYETAWSNQLVEIGY